MDSEVVQLIKDVHGHMGAQTEHNANTLVWREQLETQIKDMPNTCATGAALKARVDVIAKSKVPASKVKKIAFIGGGGTVGAAAVITAVVQLVKALA